MPATGSVEEKPGSTASFKSATRVQVSFVTAAEKRALAWFAARMPAWVNSDHLTVLGFAAQIMVAVSYALSRDNRQWLLWGVLFLAINWFGDSLDGTVARFRNRQRPRYGFYVDHVIDAIGSTALLVGLALSGYMTPIVAMGLLVAFLLLAIETYLATYTVGKFHLSFFNLGPTELRIILAMGNVAVYVRGPWSHLAGHRFLLFDVGAVVAIIGMGDHVSLRSNQAYGATLPRRATPVTIRNSTRTWAHLIRRLLKFHMVGAVGIGVQLCFLFLFKTLLHLNYLVATGMAVECAVVHNFLWHEHFTWADRREGRSGMLRRLLRFNLTTGMISIVGNLLLMRLLVGSLHLQYMVANILTIGCCSLANFWASDKMVFQPEVSGD